jgi:hypothetical protein
MNFNKSVHEWSIGYLRKDNLGQLHSGVTRDIGRAKREPIAQLL